MAENLLQQRNHKILSLKSFSMEVLLRLVFNRFTLTFYHHLHLFEHRFSKSRGVDEIRDSPHCFQYLMRILDVVYSCLKNLNFHETSRSF